MNILGWSIKCDGRILKILFGTMGGLCHIKKGKVSKLTEPTLPCKRLFHTNFYWIIGKYHCLIREARLLELISHMVYLSLSSHATIFVMILLCLLYINSLDWASKKLHIKNEFWPYYHYRYMVRENKLRHPSHIWEQGQGVSFLAQLQKLL